MREIELGEIRIVEQRIEQRVDAADDRVLVLRELLDEAGNVARVGDEDVLAADHHHVQAVHGEREDVIERQRRDDDRALAAHRGLEPGLVLQERRDHVAMQQHRAFRDPGGTARVLQEREVVVPEERRDELRAGAFGERLLEADRAGQVVGRHHLLHLAHDEIHEQPLEAEHLAERSDDHMLERRARAHLLEHRGEILEDHDHLGAGVLDLVLELARGVERIHVHHHAAGAQRAEHRDRILQAVRHHERDARALREPLRLQPGAEVARQRIEFGEAQRLAHAGEGRAVAVGADALLEELDQRAVLVGVDLGRHAGRIALQPDALHVSS